MESQKEERDKKRLDRVARHLELYFALCTRKQDMLKGVIDVYAEADTYIQSCIRKQIQAAITTIGISNATLLQTLADAPASCKSLVIHILQVLQQTFIANQTPAAIASSPAIAEFLAAVKRLYARESDVALLIPILPCLSYEELKRFLPRFVTLPPEQLKAVIGSLLSPQSKFPPADLLIALHLVDRSDWRRRAGLHPTLTQAQQSQLLKSMVAATQQCFEQKQIYTADVLGVVLNQLIDQVSYCQLQLALLLLVAATFVIHRLLLLCVA